MAEVILSSYLPAILGKLITPAFQQLGVLFGTTNKLQKLKRILERIQSVLVDAEERQNAEAPIKNWLFALKDLAYEAEDLLEDFDFEAQRKQRSLNQDNNMRGKVLSYCSFYKPIMTRFSLGWRLNDIIEKMEATAEEIQKFSFQLNRPQISCGRPTKINYVDQKDVFGRGTDKKDIVRFLIDREASNNKKVVVYPIVGMGGMGKTTLSRLVFKDPQVEKIFHPRLWVCVSDVEIDDARLVTQIIQAAKEDCKDLNTEQLQDRLLEIISGKRYLIVLDDVWNEDPTKWNSLKALLDCGGEGSAVIVSTRSTLAAKMMATHKIHDLKQLSEEDSWKLFRRRAFVEGAEEPANLVKIGKDITKRCGGIPLAINTLGSMMSLKNNEEDWKAVLDSELWETKAATDHILPALRLSYNYLLPHLKQCFAFCAIYPKDYVMEKETLIQLWMANGYIPSDGKGDLEATGRDIFDELVWRSFFQNVEEVIFGLHRGIYEYGDRVIVTCQMHDLMHDLALSIMGKECLNFGDTPKCEDIPSTARHLQIPSFLELISPKNQPILSTIRTIIKPDTFIPRDGLIQTKHLRPWKSLRVLSLRRCMDFDKTVNVRHLRHMRYLDLSNSGIMELPEGICSLYNLQTLNLSGCRIKKLPDNLTDLVNLRHLYIDGCNDLVCMPRGMGGLKQLHTLTRYIVSSEAERGIEQLRDLNLGGRLELYGIENVSNAIDAEEASLSSKRNLHSIKLIWKGLGLLEVFEALKPHYGLRMLVVDGYGGPQFPKWMNFVQQFQNLVKIYLLGCGKCKELPPLWRLPFLEVLKLSDSGQVKHIISKMTMCDGEFHKTLFPSLRELHVSSMVNLEGWWEVDGSNAQNFPDTLQFLPCLLKLNICSCNNLTTIPFIPFLKYLSLDSCTSNLANLSSFKSDEGLRLSQLQVLRVRSLQSLDHLTVFFPSVLNLTISECNSVESLPGPGSLTKLQYLYLYNCDGLTSLPERMESLTSLDILNCNGLTSLPEGLTKLNSLCLRSCDGLASLPQGMEGLTNLEIFSCKGLTSLLETLTKLDRLDIRCCDGLVSLPQGMESLTNLDIRSCKGLTSLPEGLIKLHKLKLVGCDGLVSLPERMESFTHLKYLDIRRCDRLCSLPEALLQRLPGLLELTIIGHDKLIKRLQLDGENWRRIKNVPGSVVASTSAENTNDISRFLENDMW